MKRHWQILVIMVLFLLFYRPTHANTIWPGESTKKRVTTEGTVYEIKATWGNVELIVEPEVEKQFNRLGIQPDYVRYHREPYRAALVIIPTRVILGEGTYKFLKVNFYQKAFLTGSRKPLQGCQDPDHRGDCAQPCDGVVMRDPMPSTLLYTDKPWDIAVLSYDDNVKIIKCTGESVSKSNTEAHRKAVKMALLEAISMCADPGVNPVPSTAIKEVFGKAADYLKHSSIRSGVRANGDHTILATLYFDASFIKEILLKYNVPIAKKIK